MCFVEVLRPPLLTSSLYLFNFFDPPLHHIISRHERTEPSGQCIFESLALVKSLFGARVAPQHAPDRAPWRNVACSVHVAPWNWRRNSLAQPCQNGADQIAVFPRVFLRTSTLSHGCDPVIPCDYILLSTLVIYFGLPPCSSTSSDYSI